MEEEAIPTRGRWTGTQIAVLAVLLVVTNAVTGAVVFFTAPSAGGQALTVIGPWAGTEMEAFLPVLDEFSAQTGIDVEYTIARQEDLRQILPTQFSAQRAPGDVIFMVSSFIRDTAGPGGHAMDVSDLISEDDFIPGALDPVESGEDLWGGIYTGKVKPGFWYRQSFFDANGLSEPTTWQEFMDLLDAIENVAGIDTAIVSGDGVGWPLSDVTEHFIATYGGAQMHRDLVTGTAAWTSTPVRDVFANRLVPALAQGHFSEPLAWDSTALDRWWNGQHALYFMGSWITGMVDDPDDLGVFALPSMTGVSQGLVFAADYMFIPTYTDQPQQARELFRFLASVEGQTAQVAQGGHIATAQGVPLDAYPAVDRRVANLLEGVEVLTDLDDNIGGTFQTTFWSQLQGLWTASDPAGSLDQVLQALETAAA